GLLPKPLRRHEENGAGAKGSRLHHKQGSERRRDTLEKPAPWWYQIERRRRPSARSSATEPGGRSSKRTPQAMRKASAIFQICERGSVASCGRAIRAVPGSAPAVARHLQECGHGERIPIPWATADRTLSPSA